MSQVKCCVSQYSSPFITKLLDASKPTSIIAVALKASVIPSKLYPFSLQAWAWTGLCTVRRAWSDHPITSTNTPLALELQSFSPGCVGMQVPCIIQDPTHIVCKLGLADAQITTVLALNLFTMDTGRFCMLCKIHAKWSLDNYSCSIHWVRKCRLQPLSGQNDPHARSIAGKDTFSVHVLTEHISDCAYKLASPCCSP